MTPSAPRVALISAAGLILGFTMALEGLALRVLGAPWNPAAPWARWAGALGVSAGDLGWLLIIFGGFWLGAVTALWLRLAWYRPLLRGLALLSLAFLWPGLLGALALVVDLWPQRGGPSEERGDGGK